MKVNLWYPGLMAIAGFLLTLFVNSVAIPSNSMFITNQYVNIAMYIVVPIAFALIGFLWGSKK